MRDDGNSKMEKKKKQRGKKKLIFLAFVIFNEFNSKAKCARHEKAF